MKSGNVLVGDTKDFAIEAYIHRSLRSASQVAIGYFCLYIARICYGRREPEATLLGCSLSAVDLRMERRGGHSSQLLSSFTSERLAMLVDAVVWGDPAALLSDSEQSEFKEALFQRGVLWAPDGDEAFDDGSVVLQLDEGDRVRLVAFRRVWLGECTRIEDLTDLSIASISFYEMLKRWRDKFVATWEERLGMDLEVD